MTTKRHIKRVQLKSTTGDQKVILVFGPPASGVSSILDVLKNASQTPMAILPYAGRQTLPHIEEALLHHNLIFLDVDGGIIGPEDIQELVDAGVLNAGSGAVMRVHADPEECLGRCKDREGYINADELREWQNAVLPIEDMIQRHSLKYFMVPSNDHALEEAVRIVALRAGITD